MNAVREWAVSQGLEVGARGRLSRDVFASYLIAHPVEARKFLVSKGEFVGTRGRISKASIYRAVNR